MTYLKQAVLAIFVLLLGSSQIAHAANCASFPYTLTNGQTADANQVMANFNTVRDCGNNNLLGKNNNLSDVQSAGTSRSNLGLGAAAVEGLANTTNGAITDDGAGNLIAAHYPTVHTQVFTGTGTFTVPAATTAATVFKFTVVGGGGGGGDPGGNFASSGASGGVAVGLFSGFTAGASVTVSVGAGGAHSSGGTVSTVAYSATTVVTANGGSPGSSTPGVAPAAGTTVISAGASGLTLQSSYAMMAENGGVLYPNSNPGFAPNGGSSAFGGGGRGVWINGTTPTTGGDGVNGSGGGAGYRSGTGGAGGVGMVLVEWVL